MLQWTCLVVRRLSRLTPSIIVVVWIMLSGPHSERIPAMFNPLRDDKSHRRAREKISTEDCKWLEELADVVQAEFRTCGWEWEAPRSVLNQPSA
jgi:CRISPR/Cas system endoribonuclease Cas6 (RAMP superfamily)